MDNDKVINLLNSLSLYPYESWQAILTPALIAQRVSFSEKVVKTDPKSPTFAELIELGVYVNTYDDQTDGFIPRFSGLQLRKFTDIVRKGSNGGSVFDSFPVLKSLADILWHMFHFEANSSWQQLEKWHYHWELLVRLLRPQQVTSAHQHYCGVGYYNPNEWSPSTVLFKSRAATAVYLGYQWPSKAPPRDENDQLVDLRHDCMLLGNGLLCCSTCQLSSPASHVDYFDRYGWC
jgi:hypothetical protein